MPAHWCLEPVSAKVKLAQLDPRDVGDFERGTAEADYAALQERMAILQERLWAEGSRSLLLVLQAMDTGGKDGTIKRVMAAVNPQGVRIASFKAPTEEELDHDFLWRIHKQTPCRGEIGIFNRSHYEDVLIVRVKNLAPKSVWSARYDRINEFEAHLVASGTHIVKCFLHISRAEQKERLQERLADPERRWKFNPGDLVERGYWDDYQKAYETVLERCNTAEAPWHVIPADRKWFRNWAISQILVDTLERMDPQFPVVDHGDLEIPD